MMYSCIVFGSPAKFEVETFGYTASDNIFFFANPRWRSISSGTWASRAPTVQQEIICDHFR